jgi:CheY-like chemotaxis protein
MMTAAYVSVEDARQAEDFGADEYVVKPFLREVLIHNVERLLPPASAD